MLRNSLRCLNEFENRTRWSYAWRNRPYGTTFLMQGAHRRIPLYRLKFVTKDSNRLSNYASRYSYFLKELDVEKNKELGVEPDDVRLDDRRYLHYKCQKCGTEYRKVQAAMLRYHDMCPRCKVAGASTSAALESKFETVGKAHPKLLEQLGAAEIPSYIANLPVTSCAPVMWKCMGKDCTEEFRATVRARTGKVADGAAAFVRREELDGLCKTCRWTASMKAAAQALKTGSYLGLDESLAKTVKVVPDSK